MTRISGIKFTPTGKTYSFDCGAFVLNNGDKVIVETEHGQGLGIVVTSSHELSDEDTSKSFKRIFRVANEKDITQFKNNIEKEKKAKEYCIKCAKELKINIRPFAVQSTFDGNKMIFFFTAERRIDFRELVKRLVKKFESKIEMRQMGVRNKAKMYSGMGRCGREICCSAFLEKFTPISIKMAKKQGISLNPTKTSGLCGRLMCCLNFENLTYKEMEKKILPIGTKVIVGQDKGKITAQNIINNNVTIQLEDMKTIEVQLESIKILDNEKSNNSGER